MILTDQFRTNHGHQDAVKLRQSFLANQTVTEQTVCLVSPNDQQSVSSRFALRCSQIISKKAEHPQGEIARGEQIMTLVVDCEFAPDLFVNLDHRAGESVDARLAAPDGMLGQLLVDDGKAGKCRRWVAVDRDLGN